MNIEIKARWIAALRSGQYKQGQGNLHPTPKCFCALGVLCDLYAKEHGMEWAPRLIHHSIVDDRKTEVFALTHTLPNNEVIYSVDVPREPITEWAGLQSNPYLDVVSPSGVMGGYFMSEINDRLEFSFDAIADIIEAQL
jgi:hypothetical protein